MEWVSLILWLIIASMALPLGLGAIANPLLGLQALAVLGGLAMSVLWVFGIGSEDTAWIAFACAVVGVAATWTAGAWIVTGDRAVSPVGQTGEELLAALIGLEAPLLAAVGLLMLLLAAGGLTFS
jgi:hypothetical protein